jgi:pimeloyl-ACP methyl ester carboxylesterase
LQALLIVEIGNNREDKLCLNEVKLCLSFFLAVFQKNSNNCFVSKKKAVSKISVGTSKIIKIIFILIAVLIILYCGVSIYIASVLTKPNNNPVNYDKYKIGKNVTDVNFTALDGVYLSGWLFHGGSKKAIIFVHGAGAQNRINTDYGTVDIAPFFINQGYSVLLFDLRGNGSSQKTRIGLGEYERYDVAGAFKFLESQGFKPQSIGIISDSLGAISTIMAADYVKTAGGIVLDSPAAAVEPITSNIMTNEDHVPRFMDWGIYFFAKDLFGIDVNSIRPIDHIAELKNTPVLFLHGTKDTLIPPQNSLELIKKVNNGQIVLFENAAHAQTFKTNPDLYKKVVGDFFEKNLK